MSGCESVGFVDSSSRRPGRGFVWPLVDLTLRAPLARNPEVGGLLDARAGWSVRVEIRADSIRISALPIALKWLGLGVLHESPVDEFGLRSLLDKTVCERLV